MMLILDIDLDIGGPAFVPDDNNPFGPFGSDGKSSLIYTEHLLTIPR